MLLITDNTATLMEALSLLPDYVASPIPACALRECVHFGDYEKAAAITDARTFDALDIFLQKQLPAWNVTAEGMSRENADWIVLVRLVGHLFECIQFVRPEDC